MSKDLILNVIKQYMYSDVQVYALHFMYFDTWRRLNSPWYEKTNQQRFQLKYTLAWSSSASDHVQSPADWHKNRTDSSHQIPHSLVQGYFYAAR